MTAITLNPFDDEETARMAAKVMKKLLRKKVVGSHKKQRSTVANWFPSHQEGQVKDVIDQMVTHPTVPLEAYGGSHRKNIRLTSFEEALEFAEERGADTTWIDSPY